MSMKFFNLITAIFSFFILSAHLFGHCQVPCGIYDDSARIKQMLEDVATVKKSNLNITILSNKSDAQSSQQLIRWVQNKEQHAENIISTTCDYFLTQRLKPGQEDYVVRLSGHHKVILLAMKAKQNCNAQVALDLRNAIEALIPYYD